MKNLVTVKVLAQYEENYAYYENGEYWKPKGSAYFEFKIESTIILYDSENMVEAIKKLVRNASGEIERFTYVDHEIIWTNPIKISAEAFENCYDIGVTEKMK